MSEESIETAATGSLRILVDLVSERIAPQEIPSALWPELISLALVHGTAPLLNRVLKKRGPDLLPKAQMQALAHAARRAAWADLFFEAGVRRISRAMEAAEIPAVWLKGASLARTVYPESALRPMGDLDLLVGFAKREAAISVLKELGFQFAADILLRPPSGKNAAQPGKTAETYLKHLALHHDVLKGGKDGSVTVELHFGLQAYNQAHELLPERHLTWFMENPQAFYSDQKAPCLAPSPEAHLLYLAAHHMIQHGEEKAMLMRDLDIHLLIMHTRPNWDIIPDKAAELGWTAGVSRALERAMDFFSTPVPEAVMERLRHIRPVDEDPYILQRKKTPGGRWDSAKARIQSLSGKEKVRYVFQNLVPTPSYMRKRYAIPWSHPVLPYYPYRWFDQCREICLAVIRRRKPSFDR
jgi:hypothetical protein